MTRIAESTQIAESPAAALSRPYVGMQPFGEGDAALFFGRERETTIVASNVRTARVTVLHAASGVGKSSLARAGVAHRLRGASQAVVVFDRWTGDPAAALKDVCAAELRERGATLPDDITSWTLDDVVCQRRRDPDDPPSAQAVAAVPIALILDQFEHYFLYFPAGAVAHAFEEQLARSVNRRDSPAHVLIVIRDDALAGLDRLSGRIPILFNNQLRIERLDRAAADRAIRGPLDVYNRAHSGAPVHIEDALVDQLVFAARAGQQLAAQTGRERDPLTASSNLTALDDVRVETALLQLVLTRVWDADVGSGSRVLRASTLVTLGGAQRILKDHLDAEMMKLTAGQREVAARIFRFLVTPSGALNAFSAPDLADYGEVPIGEVEPVLEQLAAGDNRILRYVEPVGPTNPPRYEVYVEVLAAAALNWRSRYIALPTFSWIAVGPAAAILAVTAVVEAATELQLVQTGNPLLLVTRGATVLMLSIAMLVQIYRWFLRFVSMTGFLSIGTYRNPAVGIALGVLLALLFYVSTDLNSRAAGPLPWAANWLATVDTFNFVRYAIATVLLSWAIGAFVFALMQLAGQFTARWVRSFDRGMYGVFIVVSLLLAILIVLSYSAPTGGRPTNMTVP